MTQYYTTEELKAVGRIGEEPITIIQGDCLEVMPLLPDHSFDAVIADPPYG